MTFQETYNVFDKIIHDVKSDRMGNTMVQIGADAIGMIKTRVQETGVNAEGGKFAPYSTEDMYVGSKQMNASVAKSFFGKQNNKKHKWVTIERTYSEGPKAGKKIRLAVLEGGYKEFRELHNRRTDITNFSFSNDMWNDIKIISSNTLHNNGIVTIGAVKKEEKLKLAGNTARRGQILALNNDEIKWLSKTYIQKIRQFFREAK